MKKKLLLISSLLIAGGVSAQFTNTNSPQIGESINLFIVDSSAANFKSVTGDGVTWDYSDVADYNQEKRYIKVIAPQDTVLGDDFTNSDMAIETENELLTFITDDGSKRTSQGVVFNDPEAGFLTMNLDVKEGDYYQYPFELGDSISDEIEGTASFDFNGQPVDADAQGSTYSKVDGRGTLELGENTYSNVLRYHIIDTIRINIPIPGMDDYLSIHEQFEYYDFTESHLPIFVHSHLWFGQENGTPRNDFNFVLSLESKTSSVAKDELLSTKVYPNPANSYVNIELPNELSDAQISIVDAVGRSVISSSVTSGFSQIDVSALNEGTYFVKIIANDEVVTKTLVLK